jgi:hypothetical protein
MSESDKPNLDLINRVQQARMQHDSAARPSQVSGVYWIEVKCAPGLQPDPTPRAGYWRLITAVDQVDEIWATIKTATEAGQLGYKSKVATASHDSNPHSRLVHILTYDSADEADVNRVRAALTVPGDWTYHTD